MTSVLKRMLHAGSCAVAVLSKKKRNQLRMNCFVGTEVTAEETADQVSIYGSVITWEMYIFKAAQTTFKICSELLYLSGFSCTVKAFKYD